MNLEEDIKIKIKIKSLLISILGVLISSFLLFFIMVCKVNASNAIGGYNGANDTQGVWWSDSNYDYRCGWNGFADTCGTFDRALAILYNYQPSTSDTLTISASIYTQADYLNNKVWNSQVYVLWGYQANLYYDWTLQDSCTVDGQQTVSHIDSITDRKQYYITVNCTASPPVSGAYPVIYVLQRYSNDTWGGLTKYNFNLGYVTGTITAGRDDNAIIDSGNQNTQQIINNNNENTDKITDAIDKQNEVCNDYNYDYTQNRDIERKGLNGNGTEVNSNNWAISKYTPVEKGKTYTLTTPYTTNNYAYCLYDSNKTKLRCSTYSTESMTITPTQNGYIRYSIQIYDGRSNFTGEYCYNRIEGKPHDYGNQPDSTNTDTYHTEEENLISNFNTSQLNVVDIQVDTNSNKWVWDRITEYINLNTAITSMIISILSIGVIKLVLNR